MAGQKSQLRFIDEVDFGEAARHNIVPGYTPGWQRPTTGSGSGGSSGGAARYVNGCPEILL